MSRTIAGKRASAALTSLLCAALLLPSLAWALPSAAQKAEAEALFQDGKKLMLQKRWVDACRKLEASQRLDPAGGTLLNLALCHEEEGKLATAWVEFGDALELAKADKKNDRIKIAREHLEKLEAKLPRLVVTLPPGPALSGLQVQRNGATLSEASFGTPIPVDPGEHTVRATAPGHHPHEAKISLAVGETKTLKLPPLEREPEPVAAAASSSAPPPVLAPSHRKRNGYIIGGVGVVSLTIGVIFGVRALGKKSEADKVCGQTCPPEGLKRTDEAYTAANIANVGVGLGLIGLGVGTYLVLTAKPSPSAASFVVSPTVGQGVGGLHMQGSF